MNSKTVVKILLGQEAKLYRDIVGPLSQKTGRHYTEDNFSQRLNRGTLRYDEILALCEILGYEIKIEKVKPS